MAAESVLTGSAFPPLLPFSASALFEEVSPGLRQLPPAPRFIFGAMPPDVAADFFSRRGLTPTGLYFARNVTLGSGLLLSTDDGLFVAPELNLQKAHIEAGVAEHGDQHRAPGKKLDGPHAHIVGAGYKIYGHWLAEILPKLGVLHLLGHDLDKLNILIPDDAPGFALQMLRLLGIKDEQLVRFGAQAGNVTVTEFLAPSFLHNAVQYSAILGQTVALWHKRIARHVGKLAQGGYRKRILVARRGGSRMLHDRAEAETLCISAGFTLVRPEAMSLLEQWRMFADATEIIGEYGSGLHGSLFSAPRTIVCGLRGSEVHPAFIQSGIGERLQQPTGYVFGRSDDDGSGNYHIRREDLAACLNNVFSGVAVPVRAPVTAAKSAEAESTADLIGRHDVLARAGDLVAARRVLERAAQIAPEDAAIHIRLARLLAYRDPPAALAAVEAAIASAGATCEFLVLKTNILLWSGKLATAQEAISEAVKSEPTSALAQDAHARVLLRARRAEDAVAAAQKAALIAPAEPRFRMTLVNALIAATDLERAEEIARDILGASPRFPGAAEALARILVATGRQGAAVPTLIELLSEPNAGKAESRRLLGRLLSSASVVAEASEEPESASVAAAEPISGKFEIDFSASGNSGQFRRTGWSQQEPKWVWATGEISEISLPNLNPEQDWIASLDVAACILPPTVTRQRLTFVYNGVSLLTCNVDKFMTLSCLLPKELHSLAGQPVLGLLHPDYACPKTLGVGKDSRKLSVCVHAVRLAPVG